MRFRRMLGAGLCALTLSGMAVTASTPAAAATPNPNTVPMSIPKPTVTGGNFFSVVKTDTRHLPAPWRAVADVRQYKWGAGGWQLLSGRGTAAGHMANGGWAKAALSVHGGDGVKILTQARVRLIGPKGANHPYLGNWKNTRGNAHLTTPLKKATYAEAMPTNSKSTPIGCNQRISGPVKNRGGKTAKFKLEQGCLGADNYGRAKSPYSMTFHIDKCSRSAPVLFGGGMCGALARWERTTWKSERWAPSPGYQRAIMVTFPLHDDPLGDKPRGYRLQADFNYWQQPVPPLLNLKIKVKGSKAGVLERTAG